MLERAADRILERGLIGVTLRPLAAAIGTSDRMLLYHFGSRDALISAVVDKVSNRSMAAIQALPAAHGVRAGINRLWAAYQTKPLNACLSLYCQAAASGLLGMEPYLSDARASNERWAGMLRDYLERCGASPDTVFRIVAMVDSALYGFHLDLATDRPEWLDTAVDDLARAAEAMAVLHR